jgi:lipid-binding SYLF domain-containing protein
MALGFLLCISVEGAKVGSRNDYRRLFYDINHVQLLFK